MNKNKCSNCGYLINNPKYNFCPNCGTKLNSSEKNPSSPNSVTNSLSPIKIVSIFASIIVIILFILFLSGAFDSGIKVTHPQQTFNNENSGGSTVDLNSINKINSLKDYVANHPEDFNKLLELAHLLMDSNFFDQAIAHYDRYLVKYPNEVDVIIDKGVCFFELQKYEEADSIMRKGLTLNRNHIIGNYNLGIVNLAKKNMPTAREFFNRVIEIDPNS